MVRNTRKRSYLRKRRGPTKKRSKRVHTLRKKKSRKMRGGEKLSPAISILQHDLILLGEYYKRDDLTISDGTRTRKTRFYLRLEQDETIKILIHISLYWTSKRGKKDMLDRVIEGKYNIKEDEFNEPFKSDIAKKRIHSIKSNQLAISQTIREEIEVKEFIPLPVEDRENILIYYAYIQLLESQENLYLNTVKYPNNILIEKLNSEEYKYVAGVYPEFSEFNGDYIMLYKISEKRKMQKATQEQWIHRD